jgi:hypothetical protein
MCFTALAIGASAVGGIAQSNAASKAADAQTDAAQQQLGLQRGIYNKNRKALRPYRRSGGKANAALQYEMGMRDKPSWYGGFQAAPGYEFQMQEGVNALDASAAGSGMLRSGAHEQALTGFGQNLANQQYGNHLNRLMSMQGAGQAAAGMQANMGQNFANSASTAYGNMGNAQAAGAIGQGNALSGMTNNFASSLMFNNLMQQG